MTTPLLKYPASNFVVGRGWLKTVLPAEVGVDRKLPAEITADMRSSGFVVVTGVGGSPDRDVPLRSPVFGLRCWVAPTASTEQPQWNLAEQLAGRVVQAAYEHPVTGVRLDLAGLGLGAYRPPRVHSVIPLSEPRETPDDPGNYAAFDLDLLINWTES